MDDIITAINESDELMSRKIDKISSMLEYMPAIALNPVIGTLPTPLYTTTELDKLAFCPDPADNKYGIEPTNQELARSFRDKFATFYSGIMPDIIDELRQDWFDAVYKEQQLLGGEDDKIHRQNIVALGWNPDFNICNTDWSVINKQTLNKIMEEYQYSDSSIIDICEFVKLASPEDFKKNKKEKTDHEHNLNPVFITLVGGQKKSVTSNLIKWWTNGPFCHAAIGFKHTLDDMKSFNTTKYNGLSDESLDFYTPEERIAVYTIFVNDKDLESIHRELDYYIDNRDKTNYSRLNIASFVFNTPINFQFDMVCSQFVDRILKFAKIDITGKDSSLVSPNDFWKASKNNKKMYKVYDGKVKDYKPNKVKNTIDRLLHSNRTKVIKESVTVTNLFEASLSKSRLKYSRPYTQDEVREKYGEGVLTTLLGDEVHAWRMDTGIELIHKEPTESELDRIWTNWNLMNSEQKRISDKKCKELTDLSNSQLYYKLKKEYAKEREDSEQNVEESVVNEDSLSTKERDELPDSAFGISSMRKYPLNDADHVKSAIKLFGHCPKGHEKELANKIRSAMKKYDIPIDSVGKDNKLHKYIHEDFEYINFVPLYPVLETKEFPVQFDNDGNLIIQNYKKLDYNREYQCSHQALKAYEKANQLEGIKYELSKLWFINTVILAKIHDPKIKEDEKAELTKIRAWIMSDFTRYTKLLGEKEPKFNFSKYYENSPFSDVRIKINSSTLKGIIDLVKHVVK